MNPVDWTAVSAIAALISTLAYVITALYVRAELKALEKDRYLAVTNQLFEIWQGRDFMDSQLWLLRRLEQTTWREFLEAHRADVGEAAFHRVGSFYDRVGTLIRIGLVDEKEILSTIGPYAIAVWARVSPLVREARLIENSILFDDFERMLPACHECYVPELGKQVEVTPFSVDPPVSKIRPEEVRARLNRGEPLTLLDVRLPAQVENEPNRLPGAIWIPLAEVESRASEIPPGREVVAYCT